MTIISILLGIAADRLLLHLHEYRQYRYFLGYIDWAREHLDRQGWEHLGALLLMLLPVWMGVALLQYWISGWLFGLIGLLFYAAVLVYCIGPRDLAGDVETWCEVSDSSDAELRNRAAARLVGDAEVAGDTEECARQLSGAVLVDANDRLFAVLFWFILLGPLGAVIYRSAAVLQQQRSDDGGQFADNVAWLHAVLVWLPARLLALTYALSGHFDAAIEGWREVNDEHPQGSEGSEQVLAVTGMGALGLRDEDFEEAGKPAVRAAMRLVWRTLTIWLVIIALLTLAGWAG
jgi:membrane protein required for beta-lactamase induction